jgi:hypothetical protein
MRQVTNAFAILAILSTSAGSGNAQVIDNAYGGIIPDARSCVARHMGTGQLVNVRQRSGESRFWAHANWDMDGWPSITYGPVYYSLPSLVKKLTSAHECGHLVLRTLNEISATCFALENSNFSPDELEFLRDFHTNLGAIPSQYGGSGAAFWSSVADYCPDQV